MITLKNRQRPDVFRWGTSEAGQVLIVSFCGTVRYKTTGVASRTDTTQMPPAPARRPSWCAASGGQRGGPLLGAVQTHGHDK